MEPKTSEKNVSKAAFLLILGEMMVVLMAVCIKKSTEDLHEFQVAFFRNFFGLIFLLPVIFYRKTPLKTNRIHLHLIRTLSGLSGMIGMFFVISNMALSEASLVKLSVPIFLPIVAFVWLGEKIFFRNIFAIFLGFLGVFFILRPGTEGFQPIALLGVLAALLQSTAKVTIRKMKDTEPTERMVFYFGLFSSIITLILASFQWKTPDSKLFPFLILTGLFGTLGQLFVTEAYKIASPGKIGVYTYSSLIFYTLFGGLFWNEKLTIPFLAGSLLITIAGIINLYGFKFLKKEREI